MPARTGMNCGLSPRCPPVTSSDSTLRPCSRVADRAASATPRQPRAIRALEDNRHYVVRRSGRFSRADKARSCRIAGAGARIFMRYPV